MKRKIIVNMLIAFVIFPLFFLIKDLIVIDAAHYRYSLGRNSIIDYFTVFFSEYIYILVIPSFIFLVLVLAPFQLIKDKWVKTHRRMSFVQKWLGITVLILGTVLLFGTFNNIWMFPWWHNLIYTVFSFGFGLICNTVLYLGVDRYVEHLATKEG